MSDFSDRVEDQLRGGPVGELAIHKTMLAVLLLREGEHLVCDCGDCGGDPFFGLRITEEEMAHVCADYILSVSVRDNAITLALIDKKDA